MTEPRGVFISYRRDDTAAQAGRLYDRISEYFGEQFVFMDVDSIEPGMAFNEAIEDALSACKVLVVIIGKNWLQATSERGQRRIDDPRDLVRMEIETALRRKIRIIPVLIDGATLPHPEEIPASLEDLPYRQAVEISHSQFRSDSRRLMEAIGRVLRKTSATPPEVPVSQPPGTIEDSIGRSRWSATLTNTDRDTRSLLIQLSEETHNLEVKIRFNDWVLMDGKAIIKVSRISGKHNTFQISDGGQVRVATLWVKCSLFDRIINMTLIIDNYVLYRE